MSHYAFPHASSLPDRVSPFLHAESSIAKYVRLNTRMVSILSDFSVQSVLPFLSHANFSTEAPWVS